MENQNQKNLLTIEQLAEELQVSVWTLYTWTSQKRIPFVKAGRLLRFRLKDVMDTLEKKTE